MTIPRCWTATFLSIVMLCSVSCVAQEAATLSKEDARLNKAYQERVAQLRGDPVSLAALRRQERSWIAQRDQRCGKDGACLTQATTAHADYFENEVKQNNTAAKPDNAMPRELLGTWTIRKQLPARTVGCWDQKQAQALIGTELEYKPDSVRWKTTTVRYTGSKVTAVKAKDFAADNSGSQSEATFQALGIASPEVREIAIQHPEFTVDNGWKGGTMEMPGDTVLMKSPDSLVFAVCNVYFEADRN